MVAGLMEERTRNSVSKSFSQVRITSMIVSLQRRQLKGKKYQDATGVTMMQMETQTQTALFQTVTQLLMRDPLTVLKGEQYESADKAEQLYNSCSEG